MKFIVLIKQVPDTWGDRKLDPTSMRLDRSESELVLDEIGERALEVALLEQESTGAEVVVLSMGPASVEEGLRKALAMGADSAVLVKDDALVGTDIAGTAQVLATAVSKIGYDVVIGGNESTDGRAGVIPAMMAEILHLPHLTSLNEVTFSDTGVSGVRGTDAGSVTAHTPTPAIISVTERTPEARFPGFRGIMKAKKKPLTVWTMADLGIQAPEAKSIVTSVAERPVRQAGTKIVDNGDAAEQLTDFLRTRRLV